MTDEVETKRISRSYGAVEDVSIQVRITSVEVDRVLRYEALEARVIVPRPRVAPTSSLAGKATAIPMRVSAMRPESVDAGCCDTAIGAAALGAAGNVDFGEYLDSPSRVRCDPGGTTARR
jgi:hypothetical protein